MGLSEPVNLLVFLLVVGARLLVPLAIPRYPIPASIAALVIDGVDLAIFTAFTTLNLDSYQNYDKALDIYYLSIQYLSTMRNWTNLPAFAMSRFLFYYRLVGSLLFELTNVRALLLFFPNTFEYFFLFYEAVRLRWSPRRLGPALIIGAAFAIWVFIKVPQEFWIHIAQLDATDTIKTRLFGMPIDAPWSEVVAENLWLSLGLVVALLALLAIARWVIVTKLPPADWPFSLDAGAHGHDVTAPEAQAVQEAGARALFDGALAEKLVLVGLVTIIFSRILPGLQATVLPTAAGVTVVIVANTIVSQWLVRQGVIWSSVLLEFAVMAMTNLAAAGLFVLLMPLSGSRLDVPSLLFILLLLTLLVTFYDRFRPYYAVREARAGEARAAQSIA